MFRKLLLSAVGMAAMLVAIGAPVVSADPEPARVLLVNGLPTRLDICFGKTETASNLRYGRAVLWEALPPGAYRFQLRLAKAGKCAGKRVAVATRVIAAGGNTSLVIWRPNQRVLIAQFENDVSLAAADRPTISVRHVARTPAFVDAWLWEHVPMTPADVSPTIRRLPKGTASESIAVRPGQFAADAYDSRRNAAFWLAGYWSTAGAGTVTDLYLIGTGKRNYRIVGYSQAGEVPAP